MSYDKALFLPVTPYSSPCIQPKPVFVWSSCSYSRTLGWCAFDPEIPFPENPVLAALSIQISILMIHLESSCFSSLTKITSSSSLPLSSSLFFFFKLEDNCVTMMYCFLPYNNVNQPLYIYIYIQRDIYVDKYPLFLSLLPTTPPLFSLKLFLFT